MTQRAAQGPFRASRIFRTLLCLCVPFLLAPEILPDTTAADTGALVSARYAGMEEDRVGTHRNARENGEADTRFQVVLDSRHERRVVKGIALRPSDPGGVPDGREAWDTRPGEDWILGVYREGRRLNPSGEDISDPVYGRVGYDIYANPGDFSPGRHFRITIRFADGGEAVAVVRIPAPVSYPRTAVKPPLPPQEPPRAVPNPWRPATVPFDPACRTDCREIMHIRDAHGADMRLMYNPDVDDAVAQWGDCVHSMLSCLADGETDLPECVGKSACPEPCRLRFLERVGAERDPRRILDVLDAVFMIKGAECGPGDGPEAR